MAIEEFTDEAREDARRVCDFLGAVLGTEISPVFIEPLAEDEWPEIVEGE